MAFQICMWTTLIYINASMGSIFTILILLVAFLNFSATQYNRGVLGLHTCCSSYAYWFFAGTALAVLAYQFLKMRATVTGTAVAVLGAVAAIVVRRRRSRASRPKDPNETRPLTIAGSE